MSLSRVRTENLGAVAGLAGHVDDLDKALGDLRHLQLEEGAQEPGWVRDSTIWGPLEIFLTSTMKARIRSPRL
jgi:hypothetical protein